MQRLSDNVLAVMAVICSLPIVLAFLPAGVLPMLPFLVLLGFSVYEDEGYDFDAELRELNESRRL